MLVTALREMPAPPTGVVALGATTTSRPHGGVYAEDDGQFTSLTRRSGRSSSQHAASSPPCLLAGDILAVDGAQLGVIGKVSRN
jgi:hypothetical protein